MGYRIPERPIDPPERRLTADDIERLLEQEQISEDGLYGAMYFAEGRIQETIKAAHESSLVTTYLIEKALEIARQNEERE